MQLAYEIVVHGIGIPLVFLASTIAFDIVHWALHRAHGSRIAALDWAGSLHATHHAFLDSQLRVHDDLIGANIRRHVIPEFLTQAAFSALLLAVCWVVPIVPSTVVVGAFAIQVIVFVMILRERGLDVNHRGHEKLDAFRDSTFCMPEYHALHHVHASAHFSSWIKVLDRVLGTGLALDGRRIAFVGDGGAEVSALRSRLEKAGVNPVDIERTGCDRPEILVAAGDLSAPGTAATVRAFIDGAEAERLPSELWWVRGAGAAGPRPEVTRRIQLRRLEAKPGATADATADRWLRGLRRGDGRI